MLLQIEGASRGNSHPVYASNKKTLPSSRTRKGYCSWYHLVSINCK